MLKLYTTTSVLGKLWKYFSEIFTNESKPTKRHLFDLAISVFVLNGFQSVKYSFEHFIAGKSSYGLKSLYYTMSRSRINIDGWMVGLIRLALKLLPVDNKQPIVLSFDDTMVEKFGSHFAYRSRLFDHAAHNGTTYLNGHCFVSLLLSVPVLDVKKGRYIHIPVGYRMWTKEQTKLEIATELVQKTMKVIGDEQLVCLCCDSWYPKGPVLTLVDTFHHLALICNARMDTALFDIPAKTGKRGRPRIYGDKLTLDDFALSKVKNTNFSAGYRIVRTRLFGKRDILAIVTQPSSNTSKRLFLCTMMPEDLHFDLSFLPDASSAYGSADIMLLPLSIYAIRWHIEVSYYEQKMFWALGDYKLRSKPGMERLLNLLTVCYSLMTLLPFLDPAFASLKDCSAQQTRFLLGELMSKQLFLTSFAEKLETNEKYAFFAEYLRNTALGLSLAA